MHAQQIIDELLDVARPEAVARRREPRRDLPPRAGRARSTPTSARIPRRYARAATLLAPATRRVARSRGRRELERGSRVVTAPRGAPRSTRSRPTSTATEHALDDGGREPRRAIPALPTACSRRSRSRPSSLPRAEALLRRTRHLEARADRRARRHPRRPPRPRRAPAAGRPPQHRPHRRRRGLIPARLNPGPHPWPNPGRLPMRTGSDGYRGRARGWRKTGPDAGRLGRCAADPRGRRAPARRPRARPSASAARCSRHDATEPGAAQLLGAVLSERDDAEGRDRAVRRGGAARRRARRDQRRLLQQLRERAAPRRSATARPKSSCARSSASSPASWHAWHNLGQALKDSRTLRRSGRAAAARGRARTRARAEPRGARRGALPPRPAAQRRRRRSGRCIELGWDTDVNLWTLLGNTQRLLGDLPEAIACLERALELVGRLGGRAQQPRDRVRAGRSLRRRGRAGAHVDQARAATTTSCTRTRRTCC